MNTIETGKKTQKQNRVNNQMEHRNTWIYNVVFTVSFILIAYLPTTGIGFAYIYTKPWCRNLNMIQSTDECESFRLVCMWLKSSTVYRYPKTYRQHCHFDETFATRVCVSYTYIYGYVATRENSKIYKDVLHEEKNHCSYN